MNQTDVKAVKNEKEVRVALYCRLSKDDDLEGESASIGNQRDMMIRHCEEQGWTVKCIYQDDGYSGLSMERPDLQRLLCDVEKKMFDLVLTKDLSRLSRNYLETGHLIENFFPKNNVRYLALNDSIDSDEDNDIAPFRFILGEMYSKDVSKKVHSAYLSKAKQGKFTGCIAPLGYKKSETDKNQLEIDPETAWVIEKIFNLAYEGHGANHIRRVLEADEVPCPAWWNRQKGLRNKITKFEIADPEKGRFVWDYTTVKEILINPVYIGSIASQKTDYRFKVGWIKDKKADEWLIVPDMHEAIIDPAVFDVVAEKVKSRKRADAFGNFSLFGGLMRCGQCGGSLCVKATNSKHKSKYYSCSRYTKLGKHHCSQHSIKYDVLYDLVLKEIQNYAKTALADRNSAVKKLKANLDSSQKNELVSLTKLVEKDEKRLVALERIISKLYEDMIEEKITEENFNTILEKSQREQADLKERVKQSRERLTEQKQEEEDTTRWLDLIAEYSDVKCLERDMLHRLVQKIVVHEVVENEKKEQTVEIYFNFMKTPVNLL